MTYATADLTDAHSDARVIGLQFQSHGKRTAFHGPVATLKIFEDNTLVRTALEESGAGRVLVIDAGGSLRCAVVGDMLAELAHDNAWAGIVVYGCIRDSAVIAGMDIGVKALGTHPKKSVKRGEGQRDIVVEFGGTTIAPGDFLYADADGVIVAPRALHT